MVSQLIGLTMFGAFIVSKLHSFWSHWHRHSMTWHAASTLLESDVCTKTYLRMSIRQFNNCENAEASIAFTPFYSAIYSVAEEMHICGEGRCAVLYMDITDRLVYIIPLTLVICLLLVLKFSREYRYRQAVEKYNEYSLPERQRRIDQMKKLM